MEKEFIPYKQALSLKELGFDEPCIGFFENNGKNSLLVTDSVNFTNTDLKVEGVSSPLYQQAFRWFRDKYGLHHKIDFTVSRGHTYNEPHFFFIKKTIGSTYIEIYDNSFDSKEYTLKEWNKKCKGSYEEAELECLKKLIEIVKSK